MGIWAEIRSCTNCELHKYMICQPVPGFTKNPTPDVMIIGEAPGSDECLIERPFQGMAGKLLNKMLNDAVVNRDNLYITNLVKCRPTVDNNNKKNRPPSNNEISSCVRLLQKEIDLIKPKVVFTLGALSTKIILKRKTLKITEIVGTEIIIDYLLVLTMLHPSYLLQYGKANIEEFVSIMKRIKDKYEFCQW